MNIICYRFSSSSIREERLTFHGLETFPGGSERQDVLAGLERRAKGKSVNAPLGSSKEPARTAKVERHPISTPPESHASAPEQRTSHGYSTDAAEALLQKWGYLTPGHGVDKIDQCLLLRFTPEQMNYMAQGNVLYIEAIGDDGSADLFELRGGPTAAKASSGGHPALSIAPTSTYKTVPLNRIYKGLSSESQLMDVVDRIREGGKLARALERALKTGITLELSKPGSTDVAVKLKGNVIAVVDCSFVRRDNRDDWERQLANAIEIAEE